MAGGTQKKETKRRLFFKNTGIKSRCKLQNVRSQTVTSTSNACAFLKQNQGLLNGGQSCSKCLHCTSYTLLFYMGFLSYLDLIFKFFLALLSFSEIYSYHEYSLANALICQDFFPTTEFAYFLAHSQTSLPH